MDRYFEKFEHRVPEKPLPHNLRIEAVSQIFLMMSVVVGGWYIHWRWTESLNHDALWFALALVIAETGAYIGLILFSFNLWRTDDVKKSPPPACITDVVGDGEDVPRTISVDVFFPTYDEEPDLVRLSIEDALNIRYPHPLEMKIHVLDDGKRDDMRALAEELGCNYITRDSNIGFKAGNLRNAMEQTSGDFILICDADTRPFPTILEHTLGYFRDRDVAWVQTPQWFFDIPAGMSLSEWCRRKMGRRGQAGGRFIEKMIGDVTVGKDPFVNDPKLFYDIIQRRRNWANASFCCGAGSVHRRDSVMQVALRQYANAISQSVNKKVTKMRRSGESSSDGSIDRDKLKRSSLQTEEFTPYKFHVSEDIYTSIDLHSDVEREWKSVMHPDVESKMLSPQDLLTWTTQRFKYAGGTLDIAWNDNFLFRKGLSWKQRTMYTATVWSYLGGVWNAVFLFAPVVYLFSAIAPVDAYSVDFYKHIIPFLVLTELGSMFSTWGISGRKAKFSYLAFFPLNLRALWTVLRGEKISFTVTPKLRQEGNFLYLVYPQLAVVVLTVLGILYGWTMFAAGKNVHAFEALVLNSFWGLNNIFAMTGIIRAAVWKPDDALAGQQVPGDSADTTNEESESAEDGGLFPKAA